MSNWTTIIKNLIDTFLLKEDRAYLLLENGGKIVLFDGDWPTTIKNTATWTNKSKS